MYVLHFASWFTPQKKLCDGQKANNGEEFEDIGMCVQAQIR